MWIVVNDTHEPIIDKETFAAVGLIFNINKNRKPRKSTLGNDVSLFTDILYCKDCGCKMAFASTQRTTHIEYYYRCSRYVQHGQDVCPPHRIKLDVITQVVLDDIKNNARLACEDEEAFIQKLHNINMKEKQTEIDQHKKRLQQINNRLSEIENLIQKIFEKNVSGVLPDNILTNLLQGYDKEKTALSEELNSVRIELMATETQTKDISKEIENLKRYTEITELNRRILTSLIQSVHISEPKKIDGVKTYDIEIRYKFQNPFKKQDESDKKTKAKKEDTISPNIVSSRTCDTVK